jgi:hypothetical protein
MPSGLTGGSLLLPPKQTSASLSISFYNITNGIFADTKITGNPAIATAFFNGL